MKLPAFLEDAVFWRRFAGWAVIVHIVLWVAAEVLGWVHDTAFISRLSLDALVLAALGWWQSSRVEVKQAKDADVQDVLDRLDGD